MSEAFSRPDPAASSDLPAAPVRFRFGDALLDVRERTLVRAGAPVHLAGRYFDLLALLVDRRGTLVTKQALFDAVWEGVVVSDAALTQGVRAVRRALGDDAGQPRFIETVAGRGYRFIAPVEMGAGEDARVEGGRAETGVPAREAVAGRPVPLPSPPPPDAAPFDAAPSVGGAAVGTALASVLGGGLYGIALGAGSPHPASTAASIVALGVAVGVLGGAAVAAGAQVGARVGARRASGGLARAAVLAGGGLGGLVAGLAGEFAGRSVLVTLTGRLVPDLTGGLEGAWIGLALASGLAYAARRGPAAVAPGVVLSALATMTAFAVLAVLGRPLFLGSLESTLALPGAPLRLGLLAPSGLAPGVRALLSALEGLLFGLCFAAGALVVRRGSRGNLRGA